MSHHNLGGIIMNKKVTSLLQQLAMCDKIIDTDTTELQVNMKKQLVHEKHKSAITPKNPNSKKPFWSTYIVPEGQTKRKLIKATTEEGLYKKLYDFYYLSIIPSVEEFYDKWIMKRKDENINYKSILRYHNYWEKYYKDDPIVKKPMNKITDIDIEAFYHKAISDYFITTKELANMKIILKNMLHYCKKIGLIQIDPFVTAEISTNGCRPPNKQKKEERIYFENEINQMFDALHNEILNYEDCTDMHGIYLLFYKGIRIAELAAIRLCDIDFEHKQIYIHRMETVLEDENGKAYITVVDYGKKRSPYAIRWLSLTDSEIDLIKEVISINEKFGYKDKDFLFLDRDGRTKVREFDNRIRKMCGIIGIKAKSAHDIRRTVASFMREAGFSDEYIRDYLGHRDVSTTQGYFYDTKTEQENRESLENFHSQFNIQF